MGEDEIEDALQAYKQRVASGGGKARAKKLSAAERREIARKGGKASGRARKKKAKKSDQHS
jgi:general stress protein YciG